MIVISDNRSCFVINSIFLPLFHLLLAECTSQGSENTKSFRVTETPNQKLTSPFNGLVTLDIYAMPLSPSFLTATCGKLILESSLKIK